jgi:hypothetical protein
MHRDYVMGRRVRKMVLEEGGDKDLKDSMKCRYMVFHLCFVSSYNSDFFYYIASSIEAWYFCICDCTRQGKVFSPYIIPSLALIMSIHMSTSTFFQRLTKKG